MTKKTRSVPYRRAFSPDTKLCIWLCVCIGLANGLSIQTLACWLCVIGSIWLLRNRHNCDAAAGVCARPVDFKIAYESGVTPHYPRVAYVGDAGMDFASACDEIMLPGEVKRISLGFRIELPIGYELQLRPRSGLAAIHHITMMDSPATIDCGYRGVVTVTLKNEGVTDFVITKGDYIAQGVVKIIPPVNLIVCDQSELSASDRGSRGFGSSGL